MLLFVSWLLKLVVVSFLSVFWNCVYTKWLITGRNQRSLFCNDDMSCMCDCIVESSKNVRKRSSCFYWWAFALKKSFNGMFLRWFEMRSRASSWLAQPSSAEAAAGYASVLSSSRPYSFLFLFQAAEEPSNAGISDSNNFWKRAVPTFYRYIFHGNPAWFC